MTYAQEKKSNSIDAQQSSQTGGATVASSNAGAKDAQMTQGFSLESGAIANTLERANRQNRVAIPMVRLITIVQTVHLGVATLAKSTANRSTNTPLAAFYS